MSRDAVRITAVPRRSRRRLLALGVMVASLILLSGTALAQQEQARGGKFRSGDVIVVDGREVVVDDLYVFAGQARVDGTVRGDVVAIGGQVDVNGTVEGDLLASAGAIRVLGEVEGDARLTGGQVALDGAVGEDLATASGQLNIGPQGEVGEDLLFTAGETTMDGAVGGDLLGSTGTYRAAGTVAGSEQVSIPEEREPSVAQRALAVLRRYAGIVVVGALLLWLAPAALRAGAEQVRTRPLPSLGIGLVGVAAYGALMLALIIAMLVLIIPLSLVGLRHLVLVVVSTGVVSGALVSLLLLLVVLFVAQATVGLPLGRLAFGRRGNQGSRLADLGALALGSLVLVLLFTIPAGGGVLEFVTVLYGLGALLLAAWHARRRPSVSEPRASV